MKKMFLISSVENFPTYGAWKICSRVGCGKSLHDDLWIGDRNETATLTFDSQLDQGGFGNCW